MESESRKKERRNSEIKKLRKLSCFFCLTRQSRSRCCTVYEVHEKRPRRRRWRLKSVNVEWSKCKVKKKREATWSLKIFILLCRYNPPVALCHFSLSSSSNQIENERRKKSCSACVNNIGDKWLLWHYVIELSSEASECSCLPCVERVLFDLWTRRKNLYCATKKSLPERWESVKWSWNYSEISAHGRRMPTM